MQKQKKHVSVQVRFQSTACFISTSWTVDGSSGLTPIKSSTSLSSLCFTTLTWLFGITSGDSYHPGNTNSCFFRSVLWLSSCVQLFDVTLWFHSSPLLFGSQCLCSCSIIFSGWWLTSTFESVQQRWRCLYIVLHTRHGGRFPPACAIKGAAQMRCGYSLQLGRKEVKQERKYPSVKHVQSSMFKARSGFLDTVN